MLASKILKNIHEKGNTVTEKFSFIKEIPQELLVSINTIQI